MRPRVAAMSLKTWFRCFQSTKLAGAGVLRGKLAALLSSQTITTPIGIGERQRAQQHGVQGREDCGVRADPQRQRAHRHRGEARVSGAADAARNVGRSRGLPSILILRRGQVTPSCGPVLLFSTAHLFLAVE